MRIALAAALALPMTCTLAFADEVGSEAPSIKDETQIDALINSVIAGLKSNTIKPAVSAFLLTNPTMRGKVSEIDYFAVQAEGSIAAYGRISDCQLVEKVNRGQWSESRLYICQHERFLTRWLFDVIKTSSGWQSANVSYDDKFNQGLGK